MADSVSDGRGIRLPFWPIAAAVVALTWWSASAARPEIDLDAVERRCRQPRPGMPRELMTPRWSDDQQVRLPNGTHARWGEVRSRFTSSG